MNSFLVFKNLYSKEKCEMQFNELELRSFLYSNNLFYKMIFARIAII